MHSNLLTVRLVSMVGWSGAFLRTLVSLGPLLAGVLILFCPAANAAKTQWDPIDPADLAVKDSVTNPGVGAEILFFRELENQRYVRAKIYNQAGVDEAGLLKIQYPANIEILGLEARVVKPDGTSVELKKKDFLESTHMKIGATYETKQVALAFPNLAPGDIVEYRCRTENIGWMSLIRFCQEEIPVREYTFVNQIPLGGSMIVWQNCQEAKATGEGSSKPGVIIRNLPAFVREPYMPPEMDCRGWLRVVSGVYGEFSRSPDEQWQRHGKETASSFLSETKPDKPMIKFAGELVAGCGDDEEKLRRLYDFCQTEVVNYQMNESQEILQQKEKLARLPQQSASSTFKLRKGRISEINRLFAGLARAAGFEVREASMADRRALLNIRIRQGWFFCNRPSIAVKVGGEWRCYNPGHYFVTFGMCHPDLEGGMAYLNDVEKSGFVQMPSSLPAKSVLRRKAQFSLAADGGLEGEVEETLTGHLAVLKKERRLRSVPEAMDKEFRADYLKRLPTAEITGLRWENLETRNLPVIIRYKMTIPGFAQQIGSRLTFATDVFKMSKPVDFSAEHRRYSIVFPYTWGEHDEIEITLPDGYELDQPSAPKNVAQLVDPIHSEYQVQYKVQRRTLVFQRDFSLGENGLITFPVKAYPWLRKTFSALHESEAHRLILKPVVKTTETSPSARPEKINPDPL